MTSSGASPTIHLKLLKCPVLRRRTEEVQARKGVEQAGSKGERREEYEADGAGHVALAHQPVWQEAAAQAPQAVGNRVH